MTQLFIQLGSHPALSMAELEALVAELPVETVADFTLTQPLPELAQLELSAAAQELPALADELQTKAGGIVKILQHSADLGTLESETDITTEELEAAIAECIITTTDDPSERITFGVGKLGFEQVATPEPMQIKKILRKEKLKTRFVEAPAAGLSAAVLQHQDVREFLALYLDGSVILAETLTSQRLDDWTQRDRDKPYSDHARGMLPPKLARIMLNLGIGSYRAMHGVEQGADTRSSATGEQLHCYDPFCGTGTIGIEASLRDLQISLSDLSPEAVGGTQRNLSWMGEAYPDSTSDDASIFIADATRVTAGDLPRKVDLIVTEPFLGKQTPDPAQLPDIYDGLERMYLGAFKQWRDVLQPGATVCMVMPVVETEKRTFDLERLIDKLPSLGYTSVSQPLRYARPGAIVQRDIRRFHYAGPAK
jgi:tRNA G10  N-methylase Trm11